MRSYDVSHGSVALEHVERQKLANLPRNDAQIGKQK